MNKKLLVPDIGDFEKVEVIEILVKKGDKVSIIESKPFSKNKKFEVMENSK